MKQRTFDADKYHTISEYDLPRIRETVAGKFCETLARLHIDLSLIERLEDIYIPLAALITETARNYHYPIVVGINGAQGSGKSTLCEILSLILEDGFERNVAGFSIDDIYATRAERSKMARDIHPLMQTRGVPGTHDLELGNQLLDELLSQGSAEKVLIPTFDKATDDRRPPEEWRSEKIPVDIILFEGWCVGACSQDEEDLTQAVNELEEREDPDGRWRRYVNDRLATDYAAFFNRIDLLMMLQIPDFDYVYTWRKLQESKLASACSTKARIMDDNELRRFIMHYERLTRHTLTEMPQRADILLPLNQDHQIEDIMFNDQLA